MKEAAKKKSLPGTTSKHELGIRNDTHLPKKSYFLIPFYLFYSYFNSKDNIKAQLDLDKAQWGVFQCSQYCEDLNAVLQTR